MSFLKIINILNWVLISVYGGWIFYGFMVHNKQSEMNMEALFLGFCFFVFIVLVGLNWIPYLLTKLIALFLVSLVLWTIYTHE